jgi:hypothetical protein
VTGASAGHYFFPSFLRKQESMKPLGNPETGAVTFVFCKEKAK